MNREDIIRMAKAYAWMREGKKEAEDFLVDFFNAAYAAGAAAEREACAQIGESFDKERPQSNYGRCLAVAIRARGNRGWK